MVIVRNKVDTLVAEGGVGKRSGAELRRQVQKNRAARFFCDFYCDYCAQAAAWSSTARSMEEAFLAVWGKYVHVMSARNLHRKSSKKMYEIWGSLRSR